MKNRFLLGKQIEVPQLLRDWAESHKDQSGVLQTSYAGKPVYLIAAGMCPSGGYRVAVEPTTRDADIVVYSIVAPSPEDFVIQIITYPYELVFAEQPLRFFRQDGEKITEIIPHA